MSTTKEIFWEDYNANYLVPLSAEDADGENDELQETAGDTDGDVYGSESPDKLRRANPIPVFDAKNYVYSPWGALSRNDPFSPIKFYPDMKMMHTKGFSLHLYEGEKTFENTLDSVDGIAAWKSIDPYCFIVAKARAYKWKDVIDGITKAFGITKRPQEKSGEIDNLIARLALDEDYKKTTYVITNGDIQSSKQGDEDYEEFVDFALTLATDGATEGTTVIHDGEVLCRAE